MKTQQQIITDYLKQLGITNPVDIIYNPSYEALFDYESDTELTSHEQGYLSELGAINVLTGAYTGRSPKDKYIVKDDTTKDTLWWTSAQVPNDNKPIDDIVWRDLKKQATKQLSNKRLFVMDCFCGANPNTRLSVRFIMEVAWQAHFVKNMFIRPSESECIDFKPNFTVINASKTCNSNWQEQGLNSDTVIAFNLTENTQIIAGTWYGGEMKKGLFSVMNYLLPQQGIAAMHCAANQGEDGDVAIFFGLSGTGKTTLSTDPKRQLIGDDEHGWDDEGIFNFEGGCYAKTINLSQVDEPDIYHAIVRDALLENVAMDDDGQLDFNDGSHTENTRVSYPIYHIDNIVKPISRGDHAKKVIFLTADAFGVLPPVSCLNEAQAQYHFLSGFTSKVAGTERGINKPIPTFSACFGKAFLTLHPSQYAEVLIKRMKAVGATAYLVNTGWNGLGNRISIKATRAIIDAILDGSIHHTQFQTLPIFNFDVPMTLPAVDSQILDPRNTHQTIQAWQQSAVTLAQKFTDNFKQFEDTKLGQDLVAFGPKF